MIRSMCGVSLKDRPAENCGGTIEEVSTDLPSVQTAMTWTFGMQQHCRLGKTCSKYKRQLAKDNLSAGS